MSLLLYDMDDDIPILETNQAAQTALLTLWTHNKNRG